LIPSVIPDNVGVYNYTLTITNLSNGCEAQATATVEVENCVSCFLTQDTAITICSGDSITVGTHTYTSSGTYTDTLPAASMEACDTIITTTLTVNSVSAAPTVDTTAATCMANGTAIITNYNASYTYTFSPTGPTVGAGGVISNLTPNTNYTVTATQSGCVSPASTAFEIDSILPTPAVPIIQTTPADCKTAGTAMISNYSSYPSGVTFTFSPTGPSVSTNGLISGMISDTFYIVTVTVDGCTLAAVTSVLFKISKVLLTPDKPVITTAPATRDAKAAVKISNFNPAYTYVFTPGGPTVGEDGTILDLAPNTFYKIQATLNGCESK
jgi:hypothetical protein